jgi:hypothetical protein
MSSGDFGVFHLRCPGCRQNGTFAKAIPGETDGFDRNERVVALTRLCPNPDCRALVQIVASYADNGEIEEFVVFPAEALDFDAADLPKRIVESFEEALRCHQVGAHTAAAIMIRRTLEELCQDRGAEGGTLKDRIEALKDKLTIPRDLLDAMDELRLLGNDAAHLEKRVFAEIGAQELQVAIDFTKELLRATYQYASVVSRLRGLRSGTTHTPTE